MTIYAKETDNTKKLNARLRERKALRGNETQDEVEKVEYNDEKRSVIVSLTPRRPVLLT